jgi:hypothetical protein
LQILEGNTETNGDTPERIPFLDDIDRTVWLSFLAKCRYHLGKDQKSQKDNHRSLAN